MRIHEYQARELLRQAGIPVVDAEVASSPDEARAAAARLGDNVVVKAQVLTGGRGRAGGVKRARDPEAAAEVAQTLLGMSIKGMAVSNLLVARAAPVRRELYLGVTVDRSAKAAVIMGCATGGMEIESIASADPASVIRLKADPISGLEASEATLRILARQMVGEDGPTAQACSVIRGMHELFVAKDCSIVEVNPLAQLQDGSLLALDAKIVFDDNALYRHPEIEKLRPPDDLTPDELEAAAAGLSFVAMDGDIGCVVNGAGLAMATMDLIRLEGGDPANFLDVGGSSSPGKVLTAFKILARNPRLKAIVVNIFGGITRCDDVARGIVMARDSLGISVPVVIRLVGTNQDEGRCVLEEAGMMHAMDDISAAVRGVVAASRRPA